MDKAIKTLAEVTRGGTYVKRADGSIVRAEDDAAAAAAPADGGPGGAVGTANGDSQALPEVKKASGAKRAAAGT